METKNEICFFAWDFQIFPCLPTRDLKFKHVKRKQRQQQSNINWRSNTKAFQKTEYFKNTQRHQKKTQQHFRNHNDIKRKHDNI